MIWIVEMKRKIDGVWIWEPQLGRCYESRDSGRKDVIFRIERELRPGKVRLACYGRIA